MSDNIPLKIQTEILKRLPVISLIRFRSVSKKWKSVIDSPKFIADHCVIQQSQNHLLISCLESSSRDFVVRYFSVEDDDTFPHQQKASPVSVSVNLLHSPRSIVAVSGGLFCIYGSNRRNIMKAVICNPSIKKTVTIVVPNVSNMSDFIDDGYSTIVGFGVCPRASDPKLVKITFPGMYQEEYATIPNQVEVFSLSSGLWKPPLSGKLPRKSIGYMYPQVAINQFIYWLVRDMSSQQDYFSDQRCRLIMSFHLTSEEFTEVYLPHSLASCKTHLYMSKLNESLVVLEQKNLASNANVWIMQYGRSFTHMFTFNAPITSLRRDVAGFRKNGELLLVPLKEDLKERELIVYQPNSKQIHSTGIAGPFHDFSASPYTQTLLLLDHKDSVPAKDRLLPPAQSTVTSNLQTPPSFEVDDEDEPSLSHELTKLIKLLQGSLRGSANTSQSGAGNPLFERDRGVYEEYSATSSERLKRKRGKPGVEPSNQRLGVRMESANRTVEVKEYESARKMTTSLVERREPVTTQRYSLRSSSKVNKKPPLAMSFETSMDAATVERKTTVRRTARKGNPGTSEGDELATGFHH